MADRTEGTRNTGEAPGTLIIACGALAREIVDVLRANALPGLTVTCLPAIWHNYPERIPEGVRRKIRENRDLYERIVVAYADCGTGGELDRVLEEEGIERIGGPHCYAFYAGQESFSAMAEAEIGCFYLTDYLVRHFDRLIMEGLGIDKHPELRDMYFGNYTTLVYLAQTEDRSLQEKARSAADKLGLAYRYHFTGLGELGEFIAEAAEADSKGA